MRRPLLAAGGVLAALLVAALAPAEAQPVALDHDHGHHADHASMDHGSMNQASMDHGEMDHDEMELTTPAADLERGKRRKLAVTTTQVTVPESGEVRVEVACSANRRCTGKRQLVVGDTRTERTPYRLGAKKTGVWVFQLSSSQRAGVASAGSLVAQVQVKEKKPRRLKTRAFPVALRVPGTAPVPGASEAYLNRNWTPTDYDSCPAALHRSFSVVGPDGKLYPTWHPPQVVDPATGQPCTFGHEHGDDPRSSDIYGLVAGQLSSTEFPDRAGIPFGYVSEQLTAYAGAHAGVATRHEDNVGHKVVVANDVRLVRAEPRGFVLTTVDGERVPVTCDFMMKLHQGSHSADATMNNAHELLYAVDCNDGTRLVTDTMSRLGDANEFNRSCEAATVVPTSGSNLPDGLGGARRIPDRACLDRYVLVDPTASGAHSDPWGIYEVWQSVNRLRAEDGSTIAAFDPWFGVRNPSRYYAGTGLPVGRTLTAAWETDPSDDGVTNAEPWLSVMDLDPFSPLDPRSPFDGSERDFYLGQTDLANATGPTAWFTDPYGAHGGPVPFVGAVRQFVGQVSTAYPVLERRIFDQDTDHGAGLGVHAPN